MRGQEQSRGWRERGGGEGGREGGKVREREGDEMRVRQSSHGPTTLITERNLGFVERLLKTSFENRSRVCNDSLFSASGSQARSNAGLIGNLPSVFSCYHVEIDVKGRRRVISEFPDNIRPAETSLPPGAGTVQSLKLVV